MKLDILWKFQHCSIQCGKSQKFVVHYSQSPRGFTFVFLFLWIFNCDFVKSEFSSSKNYLNFIYIEWKIHLKYSTLLLRQLQWCTVLHICKGFWHTVLVNFSVHMRSINSLVDTLDQRLNTLYLRRHFRVRNYFNILAFGMASGASNFLKL